MGSDTVRLETTLVRLRHAALACLLLSPVWACGEIFAEAAEQRHMFKGTRGHIYAASPDAIWNGATAVLSEHGYELTEGPKVGVSVRASGVESGEEKTWADVLLVAVADGHRLELRRGSSTRVEDVRWDPAGSKPDLQRLRGVEKRVGEGATLRDDHLIVDAPKYRLWAEIRQEMLDSGIEVEAAEAPMGPLDTPWIESGEQRTRRLIHVEDQGPDRFTVRIEVESQDRRVEERWEQSLDGKIRDLELEFAVIERVEPERAAQLRTDAAAKGQRAAEVGEKVDRAVGEAIEEAVEQEREGASTKPSGS